MKIRVKANGLSRVLDLREIPSTNLTLRDLKEAVASAIPLDTQDFQLSLNGVDSLSGDDDTALSAYSIVNGDLIHITGANVTTTFQQNAQPSHQHQASGSRSQHSSSLSQSTHPTNGSKLKSEELPSPPSLSSSSSLTSSSSVVPIPPTTATAMPERTNVDMDVSGTKYARSEANGAIQTNTGKEQAVVNKYMQEPLMLRESTAEKVPALLTQLYLTSGSTCANDALWVALHTLMLEAGFSSVDSEDPFVMPMSWKHPGFYSCAYSYVINSEVTSQCSLIGVTVGASIAVHGLSKQQAGFKTDHLQLKSENFVRNLVTVVPSVYRGLDRLSRQFKDIICLPLVNELATAAGFMEEQGLLSMPCEVRIRILTFLDAKGVCLLGETCQEWNAIYKDRTVWRLLYFRDFGAPSNVKLARNWYELYKEKYEETKAEQLRRRRLLFVDESLTPPWPFQRMGVGPFPPPLPFSPQIIGGDEDLNFGGFQAGLADHLGRRRLEPQPVLLRPARLPDPFNGRMGGRPSLPGRLGDTMQGFPFGTPIHRRF